VITLQVLKITIILQVKPAEQFCIPKLEGNVYIYIYIIYIYPSRLVPLLVMHGSEKSLPPTAVGWVSKFWLTAKTGGGFFSPSSLSCLPNFVAGAAHQEEQMGLAQN
jgi:hypothetical protein